MKFPLSTPYLSCRCQYRNYYCMLTTLVCGFRITVNRPPTIITKKKFLSKSRILIHSFPNISRIIIIKRSNQFFGYFSSIIISMIFQYKTFNANFCVRRISTKIEYNLNITKVSYWYVFRVCAIDFKIRPPQCFGLSRIKSEVLIHKNNIIIISLTDFHLHVFMRCRRCENNRKIIMLASRNRQPCIDCHLCLPLISSSLRKSNGISSLR